MNRQRERNMLGIRAGGANSPQHQVQQTGGADRVTAVFELAQRPQVVEIVEARQMRQLSDEAQRRTANLRSRLFQAHGQRQFFVRVVQRDGARRPAHAAANSSRPASIQIQAENAALVRSIHGRLALPTYPAHRATSLVHRNPVFAVLIQVSIGAPLLGFVAYSVPTTSSGRRAWAKDSKFWRIPRVPGADRTAAAACAPGNTAGNR